MRRSEVRKFDNSKLPKSVLSRPQKAKRRLLDEVVEPKPVAKAPKAPAKAKKISTKKKG